MRIAQSIYWISMKGTTSAYDTLPGGIFFAAANNKQPPKKVYCNHCSFLMQFGKR